jgi:hypothetical protein
VYTDFLVWLKDALLVIWMNSTTSVLDIDHKRLASWRLRDGYDNNPLRRALNGIHNKWKQAVAQEADISPKTAAIH